MGGIKQSKEETKEMELNERGFKIVDFEQKLVSKIWEDSKYNLK